MTYYFRDVKYDYNEKYHRNVCVRLIAGDKNCGMFQSGQSKGTENIAVKLPNEEFSKLVSVEFDYYRETSGWHRMNFGKCQTIDDKMEKKEAGYSMDSQTTLAQRVDIWKKWIKEFNDCKVQ